jgi:hypothetical protein
MKVFGLGTLSTWSTEQGCENAGAEQIHVCKRNSAQKHKFFFSKVFVVVDIKFRDNRSNVAEI